MSKTDSHGTKTIAVCGKGGVGKTSISALMAKILIRRQNFRVLAIDADPAMGLATNLGMQAQKTVDDIRNDLIERVKRGEAGDRQEMIAHLDYELFGALAERENLVFLAIGRPEQEGCYCQVNHFLKDIIASVAKSFDAVIIDGEAGIEQINRRVMETVTHLVLVSDLSVKGIQVAKTIQDVSKTSVPYRQSGLILNRLRIGEDKADINIPYDVKYLGWIPEDDIIREYDIAGRSFLEMDEGASIHAVSSCMNAMGL